MRKSTATLALMFALLSTGTVAAHAEAPAENLTGNVTDVANVLNEERLELLVAQVQDETEYEFYVYFTDSFDDMSGAQWAVETAENSGLDAVNSVLFAVAVDGKYGSAYPSGSSVGSEISQIEKSAVSALKAKDWDGAVEAYGNSLVDVAQGKASASEEKTSDAGSGFFTFLKWALGLILGFAVLCVVVTFGSRFFIKKKKERAHLRYITEEMNTVKDSLPVLVSELDDLLRLAQDKLEFATALYGENNTGYQALKVKKASTALQEATAVMAKEPANIKTIPQVNFRYHELLPIDNTLRFHIKKIHLLLRDIDTMESMVADIKDNQQKIAGLISTDATQISEAEKVMVGLVSAYDKNFIAQTAKAVEAWKEAHLELSQKWEAVNVLVAEDNYEEAKKMRIDLEIEKRILAKFRSNFNTKVKTVKNYDDVIADQVKAVEKELFDGSQENKLPQITPLIQMAQKALVKAQAVDITKGNPAQELKQAMAPVQAYRSAVTSLQARKDKVTAVKKSILQTHRAADEGLATIMNDADTFNLLEKFDSEFIAARKMIDNDFSVLVQKAEEMDAYDVEAMEALKNEQDYLFRTYKKALNGAATRVQRSVTEQAQKEEEKRRVATEAQRKRRKQEEEEAAARRRRTQRSNSYRSSSSSSSSSYYGYGGSSSSHDSGSSFSGSGGSFDSGGSGGSF